MKKLILLFLLCFSFAAHAQYDVVKVGNWDVSKQDTYAALLSNEKSSLTPDQEKQKTDLNIFCGEDNNLSVFFQWSNSIFPENYQLDEVNVSLQWDSKKPESMVLLADPIALFFPAKMRSNILDNLKKHKTLTLRINDSKNKWNLTNTFNLENATEAIAVPINACPKL